MLLHSQEPLMIPAGSTQNQEWWEKGLILWIIFFEFKNQVFIMNFPFTLQSPELPHAIEIDEGIRHIKISFYLQCY